ncbi:MAG: hypothetical protein ACM3TR_10665, partial [Caulobacteraceae bacterium]
VDEAEIRKAVEYLLDKKKIVAEPSSAIGVAALRKDPKAFNGKNIAFVITGGNLDSRLMKELINENL